MLLHAAVLIKELPALNASLREMLILLGKMQICIAKLIILKERAQYSQWM
jgi:hypothetical protein